MANPIHRNCTGFNEQVKYIEADANYSRIHWVSHRPEMFAKTLLRYEEQLPGWLRVSQKHLINPAFIASMSRGRQSYVTLTDGKRVSVSRSRALQIKSALTKPTND